MAHGGTSDTAAAEPMAALDYSGHLGCGLLLLFGVFTVEEQLSEPQLVPYTEFKNQVANNDVAEVFARGDSITLQRLAARNIQPLCVPGAEAEPAAEIIAALETCRRRGELLTLRCKPLAEPRPRTPACSQAGFRPTRELLTSLTVVLGGVDGTRAHLTRRRGASCA